MQNFEHKILKQQRMHSRVGIFFILGAITLSAIKVRKKLSSKFFCLGIILKERNKIGLLFLYFVLKFVLHYH